MTTQEIYNAANKMTDQTFDTVFNCLNAEKKEKVNTLINLGDSKKLALVTILEEKEIDINFYDKAYRV